MLRLGHYLHSISPYQGIIHLGTCIISLIEPIMLNRRNAFFATGLDGGSISEIALIPLSSSLTHSHAGDRCVYCLRHLHHVLRAVRDMVKTFHRRIGPWFIIVTNECSSWIRWRIAWTCVSGTLCILLESLHNTGILYNAKLDTCSIRRITSRIEMMWWVPRWGSH